MKLVTGHHKQQIKNLLFIDGIARTGKTLVSKIITTLNNFEQLEFAEFLEYILAGMRLKKITNDFAKSFVTQTLNEIGYNKIIGRKQNFRTGDITSVKNFKNSNMYEKRFSNLEGLTAIHKLSQNKNYFPFMTHDLMVNYEYLKLLQIKFKIMEIYRNPFDTIYSWNKRGFGFRWQNDPSSFDILISYKKKLFPWYVAKKENLWIKHNFVERCSLIVINLIKRSIKNHINYKNNKNIHLIKYENFITNTNYEINKICKFLKTKKNNLTKKKLIVENCPKEFYQSEHIKKITFIKSSVNKKIFEEINELNNFYFRNFYKLE